MIDNPKDKLDEEEPNEAEATEVKYQPKRPRNLVAVLIIAFFLFALAVGGIATALFSAHEDPDTIQFPEHVTRSLADEQPAAEQTPMVPYGGQSVPTAEAQTEVTPIVQEEQSVPEPLNEDQTESTIDLAPAQTVPPAEEQVITPEKKIDAVAPQSQIIWEKYPVQPHETGPQVAIVIDDMGLNHRNSQAVAAINDPLTLAYLPYADNLPAQTSKAHANGHELIVHMPMEPHDLPHNNPGPNALLVANTPEENARRLEKNLNAFSGYIGINNHMGSQLTTDVKALETIMATLKKKNLWFLDSKTIGSSMAAKLAASYGVPYAERDIFLDNVQSVPAILVQLRQLEGVAKKRGYAIAIGHPHTTTIAALKQWLPQAKARGIQIVSLSTIIAERFPHAPVSQYAVMKKPHVTTVNAIEPASGSMTQPVFGIY